MACAFKHKGEFIPSISSIKILEKETEPGFVVSIAERSDESGLACNCFKNNENPLCLQYCIKNEDLAKILQEFVEKNA
jgi:hypothetical protein